MKKRVELPSEEGDVLREFEAMHEEDFWSSWLREEEEEKGENRKRVVEKEEYETETVKRRCEGCFSVEAFEILV